MGFNKRLFSEKNIRTQAKSDFASFDLYMLNPDAAFLTDDWTRKIYTIYSNQSDENERKLTYEKIKNEEI